MRRRVTALGAAALVAGLVLFVGVFAAQERVTAQARFVIKTYTNSTPISIPATKEDTNGQASPYPSPIVVSDLRGATISDINVRLINYCHTYPDDVDVLLVGPARTGKDALIMSDAGAGKDLGGKDLDGNCLDGVTLALDDEALKRLPDGNGNDPDDGTTPIVTGFYKPSDYDQLRRDGVTPKHPDAFPGITTFSGNEALSAFDGALPNGTWRLYVFDDGHDDIGQFAGGWSLRIRARLP
jgi:subtilisin-like proprotein convertase family protein